MENKIGVILNDLFKKVDLYNLTQIDLLLSRLCLNKPKHYKKEIKRINALEKLYNEGVDFSKLSDSVCLKLIGSIEICKLIMIRLSNTH